MARSLTVTQEENPRTSGLFLGFMLLATAWLALSAFASAPTEANAEQPAATSR
jgi:hypothetical protein